MSSRRPAAVDGAALRARAVSTLSGRGGPAGTWPGASAAMGVLHELASSPATAADALALLHELQVHQVELDLQAQEMHRSRAELEVELQRQTELHDFSPAGCLVVDAGTRLLSVNRAGARLLGLERDGLLGRSLLGFLTPRGGDSLNTLLVRVAAGHLGEGCMLELAADAGGPRKVHASASVDPAGGGFLVALTAIDRA